MLKSILLSLVAAFCAGPLRASAVDQALASAEKLHAQVRASSSIKSPSVSNFQKVQGDAGVLKGFAETLASQLSGLNVGPASQVRSVSLDLGVRIGTLQGTSVININAFIDA